MGGPRPPRDQPGPLVVATAGDSASGGCPVGGQLVEDGRLRRTPRGRRTIRGDHRHPRQRHRRHGTTNARPVERSLGCSPTGWARPPQPAHPPHPRNSVTTLLCGRNQCHAETAVISRLPPAETPHRPRPRALHGQGRVAPPGSPREARRAPRGRQLRCGQGVGGGLPNWGVPPQPLALPGRDVSGSGQGAALRMIARQSPADREQSAGNRLVLVYGSKPPLSRPSMRPAEVWAASMTRACSRRIPSPGRRLRCRSSALRAGGPVDNNRGST